MADHLDVAGHGAETDPSALQHAKDDGVHLRTRCRPPDAINGPIIADPILFDPPPLTCVESDDQAVPDVTGHSAVDHVIAAATGHQASVAAVPTTDPRTTADIGSEGCYSSVISRRPWCSTKSR